MTPMTTDHTNEHIGPGLTESKAQPSRAHTPVHQEIFITPRVLDAGAFDEYTKSLQALIRDLDERSERLSSTSADTDKLAKILRQAALQLRDRAAAGTLLADRLETQTAKADTIIRGMASTFGDETQLTKLAETVIARKRESFAQSVGHALAGVDANLEAAEKKALAAQARAAEAESRFDAMTLRFDALNDRADAIEARASQAIQDAEARADRAAENALQAIEQLRLLADDVQRSASEDTESMERRLGPMRDMLENSRNILGSAENPGTLENALRRAEEYRTALESLDAATRANISAASRAGTEIVDAVNAAAESLASLETRRHQISTAIEHDIETLGSELSPIGHATAAMSRDIDKLVEKTRSLNAEIGRADRGPGADGSDDDRIDSLKQQAEAITTNALRQVEEAAEWLAALAAQAHRPEPINLPTQQS